MWSSSWRQCSPDRSLRQRKRGGPMILRAAVRTYLRKAENYGKKQGRQLTCRPRLRHTFALASLHQMIRFAIADERMNRARPIYTISCPAVNIFFQSARGDCRPYATSAADNPLRPAWVTPVDAVVTTCYGFV